MVLMQAIAIAPCGMNCSICIAFLGGQKTKCLGCRIRKKNCAFLKKTREKLSKEKITYCFECKQFPCIQLKKLDDKYKKRYEMSMIENLNEIKEKGIKSFLKKQQEKYNCPECKGTICVHDNKCYSCEFKKSV